MYLLKIINLRLQKNNLRFSYLVYILELMSNKVYNR